ncbi:Ldh family oxidoreductase [Robertmurraya kyonggiensis]|uniref:Ldh family oxidoreductase n=1 Tax=Robertmurraya kyonggiensis TaxID=1037680 RepID=A0A4U1D7Z2_9BACI|nr:Ldh family oxidoreductase [Robertmurraya kyonggiensis]TKC18103.1 Ldh family oxidoreductase [Robertmurraya kyonggiensis]
MKNILMEKVHLLDWVNEIFKAVGLDEEQAKTIADHLVLANLRGIDSHGVSKVDIYTKRLEKGIVNKDFQYTRLRETPVSALIDGCNSMGIPLATAGIKIAVEKAKQSGVGIVGIKGSNHAGMLAAYTGYAADEDCIALAVTNAPPSMAPWGGREIFFGTNPISYGIPAGNQLNIIFDMATTVVAKGKIILAKQENKKIPLGWAITKDGRETTDPEEALDGLILPSGGPKGYGIAFLVEILSGLFTGAAYGPYIGSLFDDFENEQNVGQFFFAMRADLFEDLSNFKQRMDQIIEEIRQLKKMEGVEKIYLPGEIQLELEKTRLAEGIPISAEVIDSLVSISQKYGVPTIKYEEILKGGIV